MSIINIENSYLRKLVIIFAAPIFLFFGVIMGAAVGVIETVTELGLTLMSAWRGKK